MTCLFLDEFLEEMMAEIHFLTAPPPPPQKKKMYTVDCCSTLLQFPAYDQTQKRISGQSCQSMVKTMEEIYFLQQIFLRRFFKTYQFLGEFLEETVAQIYFLFGSTKGHDITLFAVVWECDLNLSWAEKNM